MQTGTYERTWRLKGLEHEIHCVISSPAEKPEERKILLKNKHKTAHIKLHRYNSEEPVFSVS